MIPSLTLPFRFDPARLRADLALVRDDEWHPHFNESDYGGQWRGVALRSLGGASSQLNIPPGSSAAAFSDTDVLQRCAYFREVLQAFPCPLKTVRLLSLAPESFVREHRDAALGYEDGEMRIHVPVQTSGDVECGVEFYLAGVRLHLEEGYCYYLNVSLPHRLCNRWSWERVHLVIDLAVDELAQELVKRGQPIAQLPHRKGSFENFRRRVLRDSSLAEKLHAAQDRTALPQAVAAMGKDLGFDFTDLEIGCSTDCGDDDFDSRGWAPVTARVRDGRPVADWVYVGKRRFTEPFFGDSVRRVLKNPFARAFRFAAPLREPAGIGEPTGFIFHMSRCGSTLISRALAALPRVLAISEAPPIDAMIQSGRSDWVRAVILALGRLREDRESRYFIKFDAWDIHKLPLIREAFPNTPWIFLCREPLEVLVSQIRAPGMQCLPGALDPAILGMTFQDVTSLSREEWSARVIAGFLRSALDHRDDPAGMFLDYRDLPAAIWGNVARHFRVEFDDHEIELMRETVRFHAKHPEQPFAADSEGKQRAAAPALRALAAELLEPLYYQLKKQETHDHHPPS